MQRQKIVQEDSEISGEANNISMC